MSMPGGDAKCEHLSASSLEGLASFQLVWVRTLVGVPAREQAPLTPCWPSVVIGGILEEPTRSWQVHFHRPCAPCTMLAAIASDFFLKSAELCVPPFDATPFALECAPRPLQVLGVPGDCT
eukprot:1648734-Pleurochrysis_carterae.AAC.1